MSPFRLNKYQKCRLGSNKNDDDTEKTVCESLKNGQSLQTDGSNIEENNAIGNYQERADDILRDGFD